MPGHTVITSAGQIHAGDHLSWPAAVSSGVLRHHAIVVASKGGTKFSVAHVRVNAQGSSGVGKYSHVREEDIDFQENIAKRHLSRLNEHHPQCNEPARVVANARSKVGKFQYGALSNNCEHFATWCKTGNKESRQADSAEEAMKAAIHIRQMHKYNFQ